jgi:hypothetical protein
MRLHEIMGIESNRRWGVCSLNEFRKVFSFNSFPEYSLTSLAEHSSLVSGVSIKFPSLLSSPSPLMICSLLDFLGMEL